MPKPTTIYCCACETNVVARLTDGAEIYPHRPDLKALPFWKCDKCGNFVGCHHKTRNRTRPLGCIPTKQIKQMRMQIHALIDPIWQADVIPRRMLYKMLSRVLGREYHTADIRSMQEASKIIDFVKTIQVASNVG